jgi:hypothetical protein
MKVVRAGFLVSLVVAAMALPPAPTAWASRRSRPPQVTHKDFDRKNFSEDSTEIDNKFLPLVPGTQFVYEGTANRGAGQGTHRVIFTVTDVGKWVNGVRSLVIWDRDFQDGELVEEELAFFAQDDDGNVWNMGEYPEERENGKFVGAPSTWLAGVAGAQAGVAMRANPRPNTSAYFQGIAPAIEFLDKARVFKVNQKTCVPVDCYTGVLVIDEWNPLAQPEDGHQFKFHAPGVGVVRIEARGGVEEETLVLTKLRHLGPGEMAQARQRTLQLDRRAYRFAADVYRHTAFAKPLDAG